MYPLEDEKIKYICMSLFIVIVFINKQSRQWEGSVRGARSYIKNSVLTINKNDKELVSFLDYKTIQNGFKKLQFLLVSVLSIVSHQIAGFRGPLRLLFGWAMYDRVSETHGTVIQHVMLKREQHALTYFFLFLHNKHIKKLKL